MHTALSPAKLPKCNAIRSLPVQRSPHFTPHRNSHSMRRRVSAQAAAPAFSQPINVDYLEREFGGHGASFRGVGSTASLMLPSGLVTSYKTQMWHGTTVEVLQTSVSGGEGGEVVIQGGVSLGFKCRIQVELESVDPEGKAEMKYLVTLQEDLLASELTVTAVITQLKVSTPDATYAVGLEGSDYRSQPPISSGVSIIPPGFSRKEPSISGSRRPWGQKALQGLLVGTHVRGLHPRVSVVPHQLFSGWSRGDAGAQGEGEEAEGSEGEEDDNYHQLTEKMSRIYTSAPREFTIIDRGRRNSVVVERRGFDEFYVFSPGSGHEWYGKYAYVCTGPPAILTPIVSGPGGVWRGGQYLHNPNM
ncbi:hypothetical protein Taro_037477 [Colocasia esculenta]|uniref:Uncharacterized protein n=1 Tax=Colocasia esculenta TaxID=4460 RepID=A0A843WGD0_COLES|nr:hypothetical protein [Colocasia esculenta]